MAKKIYAVHKGRVPGVYTTWAECEKQVKGFGGAVFKSFTTAQEAQKFALEGSLDKPLVAEKGTLSRPMKETFSTPTNKATLLAYIDGSFDKRLGVVGYGGIIVDGNIETPFSFGTKEPAYVAFWNVAGELLAARYVVEYARVHGHGSCDLYYDYMGIEMWATGAWKTNNPLTKEYAAFMKDQSKYVTVSFHKVAAHTGVAYNEWADKLAKEGLTKA